MNKRYAHLLKIIVFTYAIFYLLPLIAPVFARNYAVFTYDESVVPDIGDYHGMMQDSRGFIWFWGSDGAAYYDGHKFHSFSEENGLSANYCYTIKELSDNKIYICNFKSLDIFDFETKTLKPHPVALMSAFRDIYEDDEFLYIAGDAEVYAIRGNAHYRIFIKDDKSDKLIYTLCNSLIETENGKFWVTTEDAGIIEIDSKYVKNLYEFKDKNKQKLLERIGNPEFEKLYPGYTEKPENFVIDTEQKRFEYCKKYQKTIASPPDNLDRFPVYKVIPDYNGESYAIALGGIYKIIDGNFVNHIPSSMPDVKAVYGGGVDRLGRFYFESDKGLHLISETDTLIFSNKNGLPGSKVQAFFSDRNNNLWFAQSAGALSKIVSRELQIFTLHQYPFISNIVKVVPNNEGGLLLGGPKGFSILKNNTLISRLELSEEIHDFAYDKNGNLIIQTTNSIALADFERNAGHTLKYFGRASEGKILSTTTPDGNVIMTIAGRIFNWDGSKLDELHGMEYEAIYPISFFCSQNNSLYLGTWNGIARLHNNIETFFHRNAIMKGELQDLKFPETFLDSSKWIRMYPDNYFDKDIAAFCIEDGPDGATWLGTFKAGIFRIEEDSIAFWDKRTGLKSSSYKTVYKDFNGDLYFVSTNSIVKVTKDGPEELELNIPEGVKLESILIDEKGRFYFASTQGLWIQTGNEQFVIDRGFGLKESWINFITSDPNGNIVAIQPNNIFTFNPDSLINSLSQNDVEPMITGVRSNGKIIPLSDNILLPAGYRDFDVEITLPGFINEKRHQFAWKLEGLDNDYSSYSNNMDISFERVPHGRYKLFIKAKDAIGNEDIIAESIGFIVPPHFWETIIFRISAAIFLAYLVFLVFWLRIRSINQRNIILENMVKSRTIELEEALQELEKSKDLEVEAEGLRTAQKLASSVAHEFNNPLAIIKGVVDLNKRKISDLMDDMANKHLDMVDRSLERITDLIDKLLNITSLKEVEYTSETTIFDLHNSNKEKSKIKKDQDVPTNSQN